MRFLVIGLGSMGKRRIRNLIALGYKEIFGFDSRKDRCVEAKRKYKIKILSDMKDIPSQKFNAILISTSPDTHLEYAEIAIKNKIPFFTEVNTNPKQIKKIIDLSTKNHVLGISSMTMRFHPTVKKIHKIISNNTLGKIYFLNYHSGENLEDWHPWEKVEEYYVKSKDTGGGRDQAVFELEWIFWLFGKSTKISARTEKLSKTKAKIFDIYNMTLQLGKVPIANVIVDVIQRPPNRILRVVGEKGLLLWDWINGTLRIYTIKDKKWQEFSAGEGYKGFNVEEMYQEEIKNVIDSIKKEKNMVSTFKEEFFVAKTVLLAEKSSKSNKSFKI